MSLSLACWVKTSVDDVLKHFTCVSFYFIYLLFLFQKIDLTFHANHLLRRQFEETCNQFIVC